MLAQGHRGKLSNDLLAEIPSSDTPRMHYLLAIIRLAARFKHVEVLEQLPEFTLQAAEHSLTLGFPEGWLKDHPLTTSELEEEKVYLEKLQLKLSFS